MKKTIFISFIIAVSSTFVFGQETKAIAPVTPTPQFTKSELLAFSDLKAVLSVINKGKDYSTYAVRNFNLTTTVANADKTTTQLSEMGPGGAWSEKQKAMIEKYAKKGTTFTLENIMLFQTGEKAPVKVEQPNISFTVKE